MYTLVILWIRQVTDENRVRSTRKPPQCSVVARVGGKPKAEGTCVCTRAAESLLPAATNTTLQSTCTPTKMPQKKPTARVSMDVCGGVWLTGLLCQGRDQQMHRRHAA